MDFYPFKQIIITIKSYSLRSKAFKVSIPLGTSKVLVKKTIGIRKTLHS